jgi:dihydrofolate reductase
MRRIRYSVAMSLDGYIAGPKGEYDWIVMDPDIDFAALFQDFDTALIGRKSFEVASAGPPMSGIQTIVVSRTLKQTDHPKVIVMPEVTRTSMDALKAKPGKDIWLFGGGELFRSLLAIGAVDSVEVAVIPVLLGGGIPLLPSPATRTTLVLKSNKLYPKTGILSLEYGVESRKAGR